MKYEVNFKDAAEIFASVAKAEKKFNEFCDARVAYDTASRVYVDSGFMVSKAAIMGNCYDNMMKAERSMFISFRVAAGALGLSDDNYSDAKMLKDIKGRYNAGSVLYHLKERATEIVKYIQL